MNSASRERSEPAVGGTPTVADPERRWEPRRAGRSAGDWAKTSYYGLPVVHKPHWKLLIISYFFLGGIASGSYAIASVAELVGGADGRRITRAGRFVALAALLPCPLLLILDLGRPERFLHMLRVLKLRSPMSLGIWGLTLFGGCCALSALGEAARAGLLGERTAPARFGRSVPSRLAGALGTLPALFVGGYAGVLLAATAVPLWTKSHLLLGPLFLASAFSSAAAAIALVLAAARGTPRETLARLEHLDALALLAELGLLVALRANLGPTLARPLRRGRLGQIHRLTVGALLAPLALHGRALLRGAPPGRGETAAAALSVLAGGYLVRYVLVMAGRASADDPHATFALTRGPHAPATPSPPSDPAHAGQLCSG
ncbi:MAG TPA: NrfD/PsrC family molybdoenzyme membrane anchor subunit [Chloroflexota bacterium]|jgi:formate-dependent nitrite reductase membrane component NrfD